MKIRPLFLFSLLALTPLIANAGPVLVVGTPGDDLLATPTGPSPIVGGLFTFASLTPFSTFSPTTYASEGLTISSPDGLLVLPYSTQSNPNYLYDDSADGTADITIALTGGTRAVGVGIADSDDPIDIQIQALGAGGVDLGSAFDVTEDLYNSEFTENPGNAYFAVEDTTNDIYGLVITQSVGSEDNSGLAIADVQVAPEPSSILLLMAGAALLGLPGFFRLRKRA